MNSMKKTAVAAAVATAMGVSASASADTIMNFSFGGTAGDAWFTMLNAAGDGALNNTDSTGAPMYGFRTPLTGTMSFNLDQGTGTGTVAGFSFFGNGLAEATTISFASIGDGAGGPGTLVLGNMGFNWNNNNGIPVSIVMDAAGMFGAIQGGLTTSDSVTGGTLGATEDFAFDFGKLGTYSLPMGAGPVTTTTWNTTNIGTPVLGTNPSGTLPLTDDGIGGSPMAAGPFTGFNANFDIIGLHLDSIETTVIPVPAAVWLFGSGLVGLVGVARRRRKSV